MWTLLEENFLGHGSTETPSAVVSQVAFTSVLGFMFFAFPSGHRLFAGPGQVMNQNATAQVMLEHSHPSLARYV